jgi:hypothetical protein
MESEEDVKTHVSGSTANKSGGEPGAFEESSQDTVVIGAEPSSSNTLGVQGPSRAVKGKISHRTPTIKMFQPSTGSKCFPSNVTIRGSLT